MRYILLIIALWMLSGCGHMVQIEQARAEQQAAIAQQARADADAEAARTNAVLSLQNTEQLKVMADAAKPVYWPWVVVAIVAALAFVAREWLRTQQVAMLAGRSPSEVRLLPGSAGFEQAMIEQYGGNWYRRRAGEEVGYYLRDGSRVTALIEQQD